MLQGNIKVNEIQFPNAEFLPKVVEMLNEGHTVTLRLRGFSMRPFLEDNRDKALLKKPTEPKVGDPVLAEIEPKHFVLHRIIRIDGKAVTLLGDGNLCCEHCQLENVVGAVVGFYRKNRKKLDAPTVGNGAHTLGCGCICVPCDATCWLPTDESGYPS